MIATDENALQCDLAETYNIYDYRSLPVKLAATFSVGLRENSRIKMIMRGDKLGDSNRTILAEIYDLLAMIGWVGEGTPPSMLDAMYGDLPEQKREQKKNRSFGSAEEYERARKKITERRQ